MDAKEARELFSRISIKLALTCAYNPEGNGKSERGHPPIIKALDKACKGKMGEWPRLLPYALWADRTFHVGTQPTLLASDHTLFLQAYILSH